MGKVYVSYQLVGSAIEILDTSGPNDWTLVTYDPFKRTYTYEGFEITIVGDFGAQTNNLTTETQIFFIEYFNVTTGEGARISGINTSVSDGHFYYDYAGEIVVFSASDQADYIDLIANSSTINAFGGDDYIYATGGNDRIDGGVGNDIIIGGWGGDVMTGGLGNDVFRYFDESDSHYGILNRIFNNTDNITDFSVKDDHLDFRKFEKVDEIKGKWVDADFAFIGRNHFTGNGDELRFVQTFDRKDNPITFIYGNLDDDMRPELVIELDGHVRLRADDFFL